MTCAPGKRYTVSMTMRAFIFSTIIACIVAFTTGPGAALAQESAAPIQPLLPSETTPPPSQAAAPAQAAENGAFANVPDSYFKEADAFKAYCEGRPSMRQYYNCECLSYEYLEARIKDHKASNNTIFLNISKKCVDASEAAGYEYQKCLDNAPMMPPKIPIKKYCECFANVYARMFEESGAAPSSNTFVGLQTQAYVACQNPELAKKLFSSVRPENPQ